MKWQMRDPALVLERKQEMEATARRRIVLKVDPFGSIWEKGALIMTRDESDQVEELIMTWYRWTRGYRPELGDPRRSPYARETLVEPGNRACSDEDRDLLLDTSTAQQVEPCIDALPLEMRVAIGIHAGNKEARATVYRNPRYTDEQMHQAYQRAKIELYPQLRRRGLIKLAA